MKESEGKLIYDIDWLFVKELAIRMQENKTKYPRGNWKNNKIDIIDLEDALTRHFIQYMIGDTSEDHLIAIACNTMMIRSQLRQE